MILFKKRKIMIQVTFLQNHFKILLLITLLISIFFPLKANAYCKCACLDGKNQSICTSVYEFKNCPVMTCPFERNSYQPLQSQKLKPYGTSSCRQAQVWNSWTGRYEWERVCN